MGQKKERKHFKHVSESSPKAIILFCIPSNKSLNHKIGALLNCVILCIKKGIFVLKDCIT